MQAQAMFYSMLDQSLIAKLPIKITKIRPIIFSYYRLYTSDESYILKEVNSFEIKLNSYYSTLSKKINLPIQIINDNFKVYFLYIESNLVEEDLAVSKLLLNEALKIFSLSKTAKTLKKEDMKEMSKTYPILDKYFLRLEYIIREIETKRPKNDNDWLFLSKYHLILAAKMNLSQIESKLFELIKEEIPIEPGLILKYPNFSFYKNGKINFYLKSINAPISELLARFYLENSHLNSFKKEIDEILIDYDHSFYKLHFCFIVLYTYILNLGNIRIVNTITATKFNEIAKAIEVFLKDYKDYFL